MFGPMRELHAYVRSLERLEAMAGEFDEIYPSHGSCPVGPELIPELIAAAKRIIAGELSGESISVFGRPVRAIDAGAATFLCDAQ